MPEFLQRLLSGSLSLGIVILPLIWCSSMLAKRYQQKALYRIMIILTVACLLMPFRPDFARSVVVLAAPDALTSTMQEKLFLQQEPPFTSADHLNSDANEALFSNSQAMPLPVSASAQENGYTHPAAIPMSLVMSHSQSPLTFWQIITPIYLFGCIFLFCFHVGRHIRFARNLRRFQGMHLRGCYEVIMQEECDRLHIKKHIPALYLCEAAPSPLLAGTLHPRIYLPDEHLGEKELRLVLRHELVHLKRRDIPLKWFSLISLCINWFNPLCHVLHKQLDYYCETSCDEQVLHNASWEDVERYTHTILTALRRSAKMRSMLSTHFSGGKKRMKKRILSMMDAGTKRIGAMICALVILLTASSSTLFTFGHAENADAADTASPTGHLIPDTPYTQTDTYAAMTAALGIQGTSYEAKELSHPVAAYVHNPLHFAIPAGNGPTSWAMPQGQYLPGTFVEIIGYQQTAGTIQNYTDETGMIYAQCRILADDTLECYIPLVFLSLENSDIPSCTVTLTTDDPIGFVTVYSARSRDSIPLNAYQAGEQLQLIGRQCGWYHVQIGTSTGYISAENVQLSPEAEKLFENKLFPFEGFFTAELLGDGDKLDAYNRIMEQAFELYGSEKAYWTMEQRAWYSQITREYGYLAEGMDVNILPGEDDLTQEQVLEKALAIIREEVDAEPNPDWFAISYAYFYSHGDNPENTQWRINLWPIDRRVSRYAVTMDKQGNCIRFFEDRAKSESQILSAWGSLYDFDQYFNVHPEATEDDMTPELREAYLQWKTDTFRFYAEYNTKMTAAYSDAESKYGINPFFWPLDVRMNIFGGENTVPQDNEMTLEQAQEKALQAVMSQLGQEALDALGDYKIGAILQRLDKGLETEFTRWCLYITDDPDTMLNGYRVDFVDKGSDRLGDGATVQTIDDVSNG